MEFSILYVTVRDEREAEKIVRALLDEKLIACGNFFPVRSIFSWKGKIEDDTESVIIMKTRSSRLTKAINRIKELHSYEVPEIISFKIEKGSRDYLDWVRDETR
jgi:periplasmic divalent cation tolerance protein